MGNLGTSRLIYIWQSSWGGRCPQRVESGPWRAARKATFGQAPESGPAERPSGV